MTRRAFPLTRLLLLCRAGGVDAPTIRENVADEYPATSIQGEADSSSPPSASHE